MNLHPVYQDKVTGKWKWGKRGKAIYDTKEEASRAGIDILTERLRNVRDRVNGAIMNHGR
jgi:hypothetical protein